MTKYQKHNKIGDLEDSLDGDIYEFKYENVSVFKRLADDIYKSDESGVREALQNSITGVKNAIGEQYIEENEGVVDVEIKVNDGMTRVTISDNGVGISENVLENVVCIIGRSTNRRDGTVPGKFGMGFLALYKLVGTDGGFTMHTRSRETDEEIKGIWKAGGFERDTEDVLPDILNSYGTSLKIDTDADADQIYKWFKKHSRFSTVTVRVTRKDSDGNILEDEEFGSKDMTDKFDSYDIHINNKYFELIISDAVDVNNNLMYNKNTQMILHNSPMSYRNLGIPRDSILRIKNEDGVIVEGEHEGKTPISKTEYESLEDTAPYIRDDEIGNDVRLPYPVGTRESLQTSDGFIKFINELVRDEIRSNIKDDLCDVDTLDKLYSCDDSYRILSDLMFLRPKDLNFKYDDLSSHFETTDNNWVEDEFNISLNYDIGNLYKNIYDYPIHHIIKSLHNGYKLYDDYIYFISNSSEPVDNMFIAEGENTKTEMLMKYKDNVSILIIDSKLMKDHLDIFESLGINRIGNVYDHIDKGEVEQYWLPYDYGYWSEKLRVESGFPLNIWLFIQILLYLITVIYVKYTGKSMTVAIGLAILLITLILSYIINPSNKLNTKYIKKKFMR